jgi:hypothetical protein
VRRWRAAGWALCTAAACTSTTTTTTTTPVTPDDMAAVTFAANSVATVQAEVAMMWAAADPYFGSYLANPDGTGVDRAMIAAADAAAAAPILLSPPRCVIAAALGTVTSYHLAGCSGPVGLALATGDVTVTFTGMDNALPIDLALTTTHLMVDDQAVELQLDATFMAAATMETLTGTSMSKVMTSAGGTFTRTGAWTLDWVNGGACATLSGTFTHDSGARLTITGLQQCTNACPTGGSARFTSAAGVTYTLIYDGSTDATWISDSRSGTVALTCP